MDDPIKIRSGDHDGAASDDAVPQSLRDALNQAYGPGEPIEIPSEIDQHVAHMAQMRLTERVAASAGRARGVSWRGDAAASRRRGLLLRFAAVTSAAAAIFFVAVVGPRLANTRTSVTPRMSIALHGDVDADGRVDIIDAMLLSKHVAKDPAVAGRVDGSAAALDINADGVVDQQDAMSIRAMVVKLEGGAG